ncbi:DUF4381 domain-containing protein [Pontibacter sp. G13]|uniref:DUF4381 domain-containing protein n=1 Tax=Pontibacter sp. G13 TaxID=3074898 RepID=UPI00288C4E93|nr:DUF4381 domain-containing protein [Pontibacter sp. G13]WNJ17361.1 DUF4381 domain-containing protein [Pontibacter sp. G13]
MPQPDSLQASKVPFSGELIEPEAVAFSFHEPGWFFLAGCILAGIFVLITHRIKRRKRWAYRRQALALLKKVPRRFSAPATQIIAINQILKRVAMTTYGREQVAGLYGGDWLEFLRRETPKAQWDDSFEWLTKAAYLPSQKLTELSESMAESIRSWASEWIRHHGNV